MNVKLLCEKSFSAADEKIINRFIEFQKALVETDIDKLREILSDDFKYCQIPGKPKTKGEFISLLSDKSLDFSTSEIMEPTILFDDDASSLIAKVRLTADVNGRELRWISNTVASFEMIDGNWRLVRWDS